MESAGGNPRPAFMASLKSLCRTMDRQVADLERETRTAVLTAKVEGCLNLYHCMMIHVKHFRDPMQVMLLTK